MKKKKIIIIFLVIILLFIVYMVYENVVKNRYILCIIENDYHQSGIGPVPAVVPSIVAIHKNGTVYRGSSMQNLKESRNMNKQEIQNLKSKVSMLEKELQHNDKVSKEKPNRIMIKNKAYSTNQMSEKAKKLCLEIEKELTK